MLMKKRAYKRAFFSAVFIGWQKAHIKLEY
jgi:hypothetical protein